ncbi:MAG: hypothetical protein ABFD75_07820 [Smithella sp.]
MDQKIIARQIIEFNKTAFENTFNVITALQEQTEKLVLSLSEKAQWLPENGKKTMNEWVKTNKKRREELKSCVDDNYKKATDYFAEKQTVEAAKTVKK